MFFENRRNDLPCDPSMLITADGESQCYDFWYNKNLTSDEDSPSVEGVVSSTNDTSVFNDTSVKLKHQLGEKRKKERKRQPEPL